MSVDADIAQTFTLYYFSHVETSAAVANSLSVMVGEDSLGRPKQFGSFLLSC